MMIGVVGSNPTGGNFIFCWNFLKPLDVDVAQKCQKCQICVNHENLEKVRYSSARFPTDDLNRN